MNTATSYDLRDIRAANLQRLIKEKFAGNTSACARTIDKRVEYLFRYFSPNDTNRRYMSNSTARTIEKKLKLSSGWMDTGHHEIGAMVYQDGIDGSPLIEWKEVPEWRRAVLSRKANQDAEKFMCPVPHSPHTFVVRVRGIANQQAGQPLSFEDGDYIFVDPKLVPEHNRMVVFIDTILRKAGFRQYQSDGVSAVLRSLNRHWNDPITPVNDDVAIVGVVIGRWTNTP